MTRPSQNSPAGRGSYVRGLHPVDVAAVSLHTEARSFARPLTISSLGVRTTVHPGPSNSVRRHNRTALYLRPSKRLQHQQRRHSANVPHRPVRLVLHLLSLLFPNMEQENRSECLESKVGRTVAFA